jgi:hypothetical protein
VCRIYSSSNSQRYRLNELTICFSWISFPDDIVFRRITYATNPGRFESMKKRAILLYLEEEDVQVDLTLYKVTFFYTDSHGDKVSIESDDGIFSAAKQFTEGGLKVFANVHSRQDKAQAPTTEVPTSLGSVAEVSTQSTTSVEGVAAQAAAMVLASTPTLGIGKASKELQDIVAAVAAAAAAAVVIAVCEQVQPFTNVMPTKAQDSDSAITEAIRRCLEDARKAEEEKKQADAVTQTLEAATQKEEKAVQLETCAESETTKEITC